MIAGETGTDLWLRRLKAKDTVVIVVLWLESQAKPNYATIEVGNGVGSERSAWMDRTVKDNVLSLPLKERPFHFQELSLDDVCRTYSFEEILPLPKRGQELGMEYFTDDL